MSVKTPKNTAIHVILCTTIAFLLAFIIRENAMDYDADVQLLAQKTAQNGQSVIAVSNKELLRDGIKLTKAYPSVYVEKYLTLMQVIQLKSDSIQYLLDSLSKKEDVELLYAMQRMLPKQRSLIIEMADFDENIEAALPNFLPADWLYLSWKNDTYGQYKTVLAQAKTNILLMERVALNYFAGKVTFDGVWDKFQPVLNWRSASPVVGDTLYADILLSLCDEGNYAHKFIVNGIPAPHQTFQQRFNQSGTYPLNIQVESYDWEHDTVLIAEKTYYVTVRK